MVGYQSLDDYTNQMAYALSDIRNYASDTGASHYDKAERIIKVRMSMKAKLSRGRTFAKMEMEIEGKLIRGSADGIKCDEDGNIWSSAGWGGTGYDGVHV